ncbi:MAG: DUF2723 domain-containing protein [Armatimonadetes bacterium]|nr:DUF2723 domain-containing protein [Armatimonadota bacterium]MDW8120844.1 DUF2723 domain-containing protein [Armatimonadota bacterium]
MTQRGISFSRLLPPLLSFSVPFFFYSLTLWPTYCFYSDSGDFLTASALLTIPHPTGYPWYCLLGRVFLTLIPFGEAPWRMGLLTALFSAAASVTAYYLMTSLKTPVFLSLATAGTIAFGRHIWISSLCAEVYSANLFLILLTFLFFVKFVQTGDRRWLYSAGLTIGFGSSHHGSFIVGIVGALVVSLLFLRHCPICPSAREWAVFALFCLLPTSFYLYVPIRGAKPIGYRYWQQTGDDPSRSLSDFFSYVTAKRYRHRLTGSSLPKRLERLADWWQTGVTLYGPLFLLAPLIFWTTKMVPVWFSAGSGGFLFSHLLLFTGYDVPDLSYFHIPSWSWAVIWGGLVAYWLYQGLAPFPWLRLMVVLLSLLSLELSFLQGAAHAFSGDRWRGKTYLESVMTEAPKNAILVATADDVLFNLWAYQTLEGKRQDLTILAIYQWDPALPLLKTVLSTSGDIYRFGDLGPWRLVPTSPRTGKFVPIDDPFPSQPCPRHQQATVHRSWIEPPPEGAHSGTLLAAYARICVGPGDPKDLGYLWIIKVHGQPIKDETGPGAQKWFWWWFLRPLPPPSGQERREIFLNECLPVIYDAPLGRYEVRGLLIRLGDIPQESAAVFSKLWSRATSLGKFLVWGR